MKPDRQPVSDQTLEGIRAEFTLPSLGQVRRHLSELMEDLEPVMQQLVRVIGECTFCPGYQFLPGGQLYPTVQTFSSGRWNSKSPTTTPLDDHTVGRPRTLPPR